jgi:SAM-dependent methyltransferase
MGFEVAAEAYERFMGRFSQPLAAEFLAVVDPRPGQRVLDVGCGPGIVTALLVDRLGAAAVSALDPSPPFVEAALRRFPSLDIRLGAAEELPWASDSFDQALAQLVVQFMDDPVRALGEMRRVTRPGGLVAASVWDYGSRRSPLSHFWDVVHEREPDHPAEGGRPGVADGELVALFEEAGLHDVRQEVLTVRVTMSGADGWWEPYTYGVGPPGDYLARLDDAGREDVRRRFVEGYPDEPFEVSASAWLAVGRA